MTKEELALQLSEAKEMYVRGEMIFTPLKPIYDDMLAAGGLDGDSVAEASIDENMWILSKLF